MSQLYTPTQLEKQLKAELILAMAQSSNTLVDRLATYIPSKSNNEKLAWIGESPQMTQLVDEVRFSALTDTGYTLTPLTFAAGLAVSRNDLNDDNTGGIKIRIRQLAVQAKRHVDQLLINALINGNSTTLGLDYKNTAFFLSNHAARGAQTATQDNMVTGTGTTTGAVAADINSALAQMLNLKDEANEPFDEYPNRFAIVCPPALIKPMKEALNAQIISTTSNMQTMGMGYDLIPSARLSNANDWYFLNTSRSLKPLVYLEREPISFEALEDGSESSLRREQWLYKVRARYVVGYGQFQTAIKVNNS